MYKIGVAYALLFSGSALGDDAPSKTLDEGLAGAPNEKTTNNDLIDSYVVRLQSCQLDP